MANSMTGYGKSEFIDGNRVYTTEMKSVNNRYLELNLHLPRQFNCFEMKLRNRLKQSISRGKVDVYISVEEEEGDSSELVYNRNLAEQIVLKVREMSEEFALPCSLTAEQVSMYPEVFSVKEEKGQDEDVYSKLEECVNQALDQFLATRSREGAYLTEDLLSKLDDLSLHVDEITGNAPAIEEEYRNTLYEKMKEILEDSRIDENRILEEAALYAEKVCVDEELVRLHSHIEAMRTELLKEGESVGRKLDFLSQEMNREANTILSKTTDTKTVDLGIQLKTEIEKIREQVQNLE